MLCFEDQKLCGPMQTDFVGHFSSVDISSDGKYDCTWTIQLWLDPDKLIELYLVILDLPSAEECDSDYIEVTHMYLFICPRCFRCFQKTGKSTHYRYFSVVKYVSKM